jgi:hypothetical protein
MQQVHALEQELQVARFDAVQVDHLGNADLARIGTQVRTTLDVITAELRHRHWRGEMPYWRATRGGQL